ncbi:MAG: hypothetical protein LAT51_11975 [Flavobacteriaceae bacterium]|nr:hypothetical protein [Flavobacteriaceae bacterium]
MIKAFTFSLVSIMFITGISNLRSNETQSQIMLPALGESFSPSPCQLPNGSAGAQCQALNGNCTVRVACKKVPVLEMTP